MKKTAMLILSLVSVQGFAQERGINYDPAHSAGFTQAQAANNLSAMKSEINKDMTIIKQSGFDTIKTFYSSVSTIDGKQVALLADMACPAGLKVALGVYEFDPAHDNCANWCEEATRIQVQNAIASAAKYPSCINMIVVGNEDIYNWNFTQPNNVIQNRISKDISTIKQGVAKYKIPVGTAQQDGALLQLAGRDPYGIIPKLDFVGANIYPFWSAEKPTVEAGKSEFKNRYRAIQNNPKYQDKKVIVTEEGWASKSSSQQNPNASLASIKAYYEWWLERDGVDTFDSYYFGIFDKQPTNADADKYFGLCTADRKDKVLTQCD
ncbi:hypothetical protein [Legionella sp. CNM-4043-24]|uniref:hypothetical protein n=1 Tax=Legionella sp. CNM-4043-24 TaxID=3421646 RepID=UPI00403AD43D